MAGLSQQTTQYLSTYGKASATTSRFQILGDNRVMYSVAAAGSVYDLSTPPHKIEAGGIIGGSVTQGGIRNMITNGAALFAFGLTGSTLSPVAIRLGVSTNSGGNVLANLNEYGFVHGTQRLDAGVHYTYMGNGEPAFQDTNGATFGASIEQFTTNVGGTVTAAASGSTLTGAGTTFTTAALTAAYAYVPSQNRIVSGDLVKIIDGANVYWHRIRSVTDNTHLEVYPNLVGSGTAGRSYQIWRSGYGSYSRVVSIYNSTNGLFYNYYAGLHRSTSFPGTIQCFTREASGGAASTHFTCPQNSAAQDIAAVDVAYYKQFLLYGYGSAIGWSVAGFPTSFTTGFGGTDFPAGNISAVAIDDQFICFEYLGEQLIAMFKNSIWEIQATGTVPEFQFYKIPEPIGPILQSTQGVQTPFVTFRRPSCSGRNAIYYHSHVGMLQLSGRVAKNVSMPVRATWQGLDKNNTTNPQLSWEPSTNSVLAVGPVSTSNTSDLGYLYCEDSDCWSVYDPEGNMLNLTNVRGSSSCPTIDNFSLFCYDGGNERITQIDVNVGAPFAVSLGRSKWEWDTPVISLGDQYDGFQFVGFQLDGNFTSSTTWTLYGGRSPYNVNSVRGSGTVSAADNRNILAIKTDDPFIRFVFTAGSDLAWASLVAVNVYAEGFGK